MSMKKNILALFFFLLLIFLNNTGCEQEDLDFYVDCDFCLEEIPEFDTLWVDVTLNDEFTEVPLEFFIGDFDDGVVDWVDTARLADVDPEARAPFFLSGSEVGTYYSIKAKYVVSGDTIVAVDGDQMRVVNGEADCYPPCYYIRGGTLDVTLKTD